MTKSFLMCPDQFRGSNACSRRKWSQSCHIQPHTLHSRLHMHRMYTAGTIQVQWLGVDGNAFIVSSVKVMATICVRNRAVRKSLLDLDTFAISLICYASHMAVCRLAGRKVGWTGLARQSSWHGGRGAGNLSLEWCGRQSFMLMFEPHDRPSVAHLASRLRSIASPRLPSTAGTVVVLHSSSML